MEMMTKTIHHAAWARVGMKSTTRELNEASANIVKGIIYLVREGWWAGMVRGEGMNRGSAPDRLNDAEDSSLSVPKLPGFCAWLFSYFQLIRYQLGALLEKWNTSITPPSHFLRRRLSVTSLLQTTFIPRNRSWYKKKSQIRLISISCQSGASWAINIQGPLALTQICQFSIL